MCMNTDIDDRWEVLLTTWEGKEHKYVEAAELEDVQNHPAEGDLGALSEDVSGSREYSEETLKK